MCSTYKEIIRKNISYTGIISSKKMCQTITIINKEIVSSNPQYANPNINKIMRERRVDAGIYSKIGNLDKKSIKEMFVD